MMDSEAEYEVITAVGQGTFGTVYKARHLITGEIVALKELKPPCLPHLYLPEIKALNDLQHPRIVSLKEVIYTEEDDGQEGVFLTFEYMKSSLLDYMKQRQGRRFSEPEIRYMAFQLFQGLDFMHRQRRYMHRDLKPGNVLVNEGNVVKISDLGAAIKIDPLGINTFQHHVTTLHYEAPEMIVETCYDEKVDMWAAGVILVDMYLMSPLFIGDDPVDQLYMLRQVLGEPNGDSIIQKRAAAALVNRPVLEERLKPGLGFRALLSRASDSAVDLISSLCRWEPSERLSAAEALQHPFFTGGINADAPPGFSCGLPCSTSLSLMRPIY